MPAHEHREPWDDLANGKVRSQTDPQYAAQLSRSAGRVFRLVEFREDRLYARPGSQSRRRLASPRVWTGRTARRRSGAPEWRSSETRSTAEYSAPDLPPKSFPCGRPARTAEVRRAGRS